MDIKVYLHLRIKQNASKTNGYNKHVVETNTNLYI